MNDPSGSNWRKWDLHFHTPKSYDHGQRGKTAAEVVKRLSDNEIEVVAVTDHHVIDAEFIKAMQEAAAGKLTVLPGIELTSNLGGGDSVHFIAVFREDSDLTFLSNEINAKLEIASKRQQGHSDDKIYVEFPAAAIIVQRLGGLLTIHAHGKHANIETIKNHFSFKQQVKTDLLREHVDILEIGDPKHTRDYWETVFPSIGVELPLIICSDDHWREEYPKAKHCWVKADPTFAGLRMALREPRHRFFIGALPPSVDRVQKNKTKFIKSVKFRRLPSMPAPEKWLEGEVSLNSGLVGIIGNKGSGKSALADAIGLLGSCVNADSFSFLTQERFCNPRTGRAQHVEGTLQWHGGSPVVRTLKESVAEDEPERVKYLPQSFVENVCNDIAEPGGGAFERELKKVVFSKVAEADRLGQHSLDDLIEYRTQELGREADSLAGTLITLAEQRANLEDRLLASVRSGLEKQIAQLEEQIKSHEAARPVVVDKPPGEISPEIAQAIEALTEQLEATDVLIAAHQAVVTRSQLRAALADKLLDKLKNLQSEFNRRFAEIEVDASALGLKGSDLASLAIDRSPVEQVRDAAIGVRNVSRSELDKIPDGLVEEKKSLENKIRTAQEQLEGSHKAYQAYLKQIAEWDAKLSRLRGSADQPASLEGLKAELSALDDVPGQIADVDAQLRAIARSIHAIRVKEAEVYRELYRPVQEFVNEHHLARERLNVGFEVELVQEGYVENLMSHINQQRVGSYSGVEEGRKRASAMVAIVEWEKWESVEKFLNDAVDALHVDQRIGYGNAVVAKTQIGKGKTLANFYGWLFGLSYLKPRYSLESDGKRMEQLSPGERGTLLLIFYLLVDDSDVPLIIDQPEANLDNATVAMKLVACIRDARERRQVIIVTHNPNLAVVCDADQIIHSSLDLNDGHRVTYRSGGLEHPEMNQFTLDVLEGGRISFDKRDDTYVVCEK